MRDAEHRREMTLRSHFYFLTVAQTIALAGVFSFFLACSPLARAADKVEWKPVPEALLRVDDHPPKDWNLYSAEKKNDRLMVQIGGRYLLVLVNQHRLYELDPAKLEHKQDDIIWREQDRPAAPLASSEWIIHDVGEAYRAHFHLDAEGHTFDIDIPHPVVIFGP
jgi:hypothetical protein